MFFLYIFWGGPKSLANNMWVPWVHHNHNSRRKNHLYITMCAKSHGCTMMVCTAEILDLGMDVGKVDAPQTNTGL